MDEFLLKNTPEAVGNYFPVQFTLITLGEQTGKYSILTHFTYRRAMKLNNNEIYMKDVQVSALSVKLGCHSISLFTAFKSQLRTRCLSLIASNGVILLVWARLLTAES